MSVIPDHIVLYDVPWSAYLKMMDAFGDKHLHHVYQEGTLEMMSPSENHEMISRFLTLLVDMTALELKVPIIAVGSATRRHYRLKHALEPDGSYYIGRRSIEHAKRRTKDEAIEAAPDLA